MRGPGAGRAGSSKVAFMQLRGPAAIRSLKALIVAAAVLPAVLFAYAAFLNHKTVAAAADDSRVEASGEQRVPGGGARVVRTRVFVTGSDTWLTNGYLDNLSNRRFLVNALGWLTEEEQLLARTGQVNIDRSLPLTAERQARVLVVTVAVVPGLIVAAGLGANALFRRRSRRR